jgi:hypothetical protein
VIDNLSDLAVVLQETLTQLEQFCLMGQVKRDMIELYGPLIRYACGFSESIDLMASIFKERDRRSLTYVKEVVPEHLRAYSSHEGSPEYAMPEARRAIQVISNEGKVIQPRPLDWYLIHRSSPLLGGCALASGTHRIGCEPLLARGSGEHGVVHPQHSVSLKESQKMTEALGYFPEAAGTVPLEPGDIALEDSPWYPR